MVTYANYSLLYPVRNKPFGLLKTIVIVISTTTTKNMIAITIIDYEIVNRDRDHDHDRQSCNTLINVVALKEDYISSTIALQRLKKNSN